MYEKEIKEYMEILKEVKIMAVEKVLHPSEVIAIFHEVCQDRRKILREKRINDDCRSMMSDNSIVPRWVIEELERREKLKIKEVIKEEKRRKK